ncbi:MULTISPECIES: hypothetical protein [unclassified Paenibacillus]|uniref:hypothetical protein n=1 Tax=unclassified Paenibacillus TaxID=185978 RepID=UPI0027803559|nr:MULTISPECIES: hypothetical protein [unclassified Paenibacillus]MDQ0896248.1 bifunctional DNA-binding transcriptional regulator/antitoxin component of YhaV-PrlF toxin-antitoxin module [Paenibacillus sp. V4I7]MDQ0913824.1 bifunctional DNA-binding transcriptional regulator/antitoxin component of YhaV-PrlF toxin-antitoxin module [Paenibacillus sp. V4I5]
MMVSFTKAILHQLGLIKGLDSVVFFYSEEGDTCIRKALTDEINDSYKITAAGNLYIPTKFRSRMSLEPSDRIRIVNIENGTGYLTVQNKLWPAKEHLDYREPLAAARPSLNQYLNRTPIKKNSVDTFSDFIDYKAGLRDSENVPIVIIDFRVRGDLKDAKKAINTEYPDKQVVWIMPV